jgi:hypothetical protein
MTALLVLIALGTTVTITLAIGGLGGELSLRPELAREREERAALTQQLMAATTNISTLRRILDRQTQAMLSARRQQAAARRARQTTTARLTAVRKMLDQRTEALRLARLQRDAARLQRRAERDALRTAR